MQSTPSSEHSSPKSRSTKLPLKWLQALIIYASAKATMRPNSTLRSISPSPIHNNPLNSLKLLWSEWILLIIYLILYVYKGKLCSGVLNNEFLYIYSRYMNWPSTEYYVWNQSLNFLYSRMKKSLIYSKKLRNIFIYLCTNNKKTNNYQK